jgi:hypothetical protein
VIGATNVHWRNNLFLGEQSADEIFSVTTLSSYSSSDYNGFRPNSAEVSFRWQAPTSKTLVDVTNPNYEAELESMEFATLTDYSTATGQDRNSVLVDYDIFVNVPPLDARDSKSLQTLYNAADLDFRLRSGSAAIDRGAILPGITDDFNGDAPDLGALEFGADTPIYGPRP